MPIYPYVCESCGTKWDVISSYEDLSPTEPCECGNEAQRHIGLISSLSTKIYNYTHLFKEPFEGSYSELKRKLKENGLADNGYDTVRGDRICDEPTKPKEKPKRPDWLDACDEDKFMKIDVSVEKVDGPPIMYRNKKASGEKKK